MAIMTNAEAFEYDFGIYATELWSMTEEQFLTWLNSECDRERPRDMIVRCKDCKHSARKQLGYSCEMNYRLATNGKFYCADGERKNNAEQTDSRYSL